MAAELSPALVVAGIPFLRTGREELAAAARARVAAGDEDGALALLLCDRDPWASGPGPTEDDARAAMAAGTLREAMRALRFGPVADYFAFRWSDPTYLSGLALLDAHVGAAERVLELACGIGHFLRELTQRGVAATGVDVVFAKCWLARRFVAPEAEYACLDAASPLPWRDAAFDLAFCHDALHYLPGKAAVCGELARVAGGRVVIGHAHNRQVENLSPGLPLDPAGYRDLLGPDAILFDDDELAAGLLAGGRAAPRAPEALAASEAVAVVAGATGPAPACYRSPPAGARLRRNPLLAEDGTVRFPSERYAAEYGPRSGYLHGHAGIPARAVMGPDVAALARTRALLDLPEAW